MVGLSPKEIYPKLIKVHGDPALYISTVKKWAAIGEKSEWDTPIQARNEGAVIVQGQRKQNQSHQRERDSLN